MLQSYWWVRLHFSITEFIHSVRADSSPFTEQENNRDSISTLVLKVFMCHHAAQIKNKNVCCQVTPELNTRKAFVFQNLVTWLGIVWTTHLVRINILNTSCQRPIIPCQRKFKWTQNSCETGGVLIVRYQLFLLTQWAINFYNKLTLI